MHRARLAATLATTLLLVGCTDDPEPKVEPSETPSSTSASTSEPAAPLGPEETVEAWVKALTVLTKTGAASEIGALSTEACKGCEFAIDPVIKVYEAGGSIDTDGVKVSSSEVREQTISTATVVAGLVFARGTTTPGTGQAPVSFPTQRRLAEFRLISDEEIWKVAFIGYLS